MGRLKEAVHIDRMDVFPTEWPSGTSDTYRLFGTFIVGGLPQLVEIWTTSKKWSVYHGFAQVNATAVFSFDERDITTFLKDAQIWMKIAADLGRRVVTMSIVDDPPDGLDDAGVVAALTAARGAL